MNKELEEVIEVLNNLKIQMEKAFKRNYINNTKEIEEYKTEYTERCIDIEVRNKLNELVRAYNKLIKEREKK